MILDNKNKQVPLMSFYLLMEPTYFFKSIIINMCT